MQAVLKSSSRGRKISRLASFQRTLSGYLKMNLRYYLKNPCTFRILVGSLILFAPIALLASLLSANEYAAQGINGAVDCDAPLQIMIFAIPTYVIYGAAALGFGVLAIQKKTWIYRIVALLCVLVVVIVTPNVIDAYREHSSSRHKETCGTGW